jgi:pyridoxine 4-dehydrogenase
VDSPTITADAAGTWPLGDLTINRLGFGSMRLPGSVSGDGPPADREQPVAVLRRAVELGVNHIDTAAFYFSALRSANELINTALAPYPDDLLIATKVGPWRDTWGAWQGMARPGQLRGQVEENLRQLGRDHLDLVNLRTLSVSKPVGEHFAALSELRDAGLVRHLGRAARGPFPVAGGTRGCHPAARMLSMKSAASSISRRSSSSASSASPHSQLGRLWI